MVPPLRFQTVDGFHLDQTAGPAAEEDVENGDTIRSRRAEDPRGGVAVAGLRIRVDQRAGNRHVRTSRRSNAHSGILFVDDERDGGGRKITVLNVIASRSGISSNSLRAESRFPAFIKKYSILLLGTNRFRREKKKTRRKGSETRISAVPGEIHGAV
ncbi:hypothetical protein M569_02766 [Genlisea aurea]|uniref:Uncharacterized protein n=1 Tax=Genlisea aurea TaxID=192259 RepID=S8EH50_9LAMI|nr:hypothetical protein M569_02766 [Genlisea aurea]